MAYVHKEPAPQPSTEGSEDRLDLCLHCAIHNKKDGVCDPNNVLAIEAVSIEGGIDEHDNIIIKPIFVVPRKDIP